MSLLIENYIPPIQEGGLNTNKNVAFGGNLTVAGTTSFAGATFTDLTTTGNTILGNAVTDTTTINGPASATGAVTGKSGTAVPATAGAVAAGAPIVLNSNGITIECTTDVPTHNRPIGSLCINLGGNSGSTRLYVASSAAGAWVAITTAS